MESLDSNPGAPTGPLGEYPGTECQLSGNL